MEAIIEGVKIEDYHLVKKIGTGGFSEVWEVVKDDGRSFALKIMDILSPHAIGNEEILDSEYHKSKDLIHPNLLLPRSFGIYKNQYKYLVLPLCSGSLMDELEKRKKEFSFSVEKGIPLFSEKELAKIMHDVSDALAYLKKHGIVHKDIKPDNVMLYPKGTEMEYLLADFGISERHPVSKLSRQTVLLDSRNKGLSKAYASPEFFKNQIHINSDVFSLGIMLYELVSGETPSVNNAYFIGENLIAKSPAIKLPANIILAGILKNIISDCLRYNPEERPSSEQLAEWADFYLTNERWKPYQLTKKIIINPSKKKINILIAIPTLMLIGFILLDFFKYEKKMMESINFQKSGDLKMAINSWGETKTWFFPLTETKNRSIYLNQIKNNYLSIAPYYSNITIAKTNDNLFTIIDLDGKELIPEPVLEIYDLNNGFFLLLLEKVDNKCLTCRLVNLNMDKVLTVSDYGMKDSAAKDFQCRAVLRNSDGVIGAIDCNGNYFKFKNI
ncbi:MAG: serine/threonine protein kinase [Saprospiraceae bacterium]|nr:serine/threonine protein kinase [Candidatus Vicinibacter affinis]